jgi:hypothetical protein
MPSPRVDAGELSDPESAYNARRKLRAYYAGQTGDWPAIFMAVS